MSDKYCGFFPTQVFSVAAFRSRALICDCSDQDINFTVICRYLSFFDIFIFNVSLFEQKKMGKSVFILFRINKIVRQTDVPGTNMCSCTV